MTPTPRTVVTAGPTISPAEIRRLLPGAQVVPPIAFGHAAGYRLRAGDTLLIIDGLFLQRPAVRHKELLALLDDGVLVAGCSSMGALRAAELAPFGMRGYGEIYQAYRDGRLRADDEVAVVHGEAEDGYPVIVDALVNLRATAAAAAEAGLLTPQQAQDVIAAAGRLPFTHRSWQQILPAAGIPADQVAGLAGQLRQARVDAKHRDAVTALTALAQPDPAADSPTAGVRPRPPATLWTERWAETARRSSRAQVNDTQLTHFLRLSSTDHWMMLPEIRHATDLVRADPRFHTWASHTHRWLATGELLASQHPELDFTNPDPDALAELFTGLWGVTNLRAELGRRGFASPDAFHAAAAPFAAAAATQPWPGIHVGQPGPRDSATPPGRPNRPASPATTKHLTSRETA